MEKNKEKTIYIIVIVVLCFICLGVCIYTINNKNKTQKVTTTSTTTTTTTKKITEPIDLTKGELIKHADTMKHEIEEYLEEKGFNPYDHNRLPSGNDNYDVARKTTLARVEINLSYTKSYNDYIDEIKEDIDNSLKNPELAEDLKMKNKFYAIFASSDFDNKNIVYFEVFAGSTDEEPIE